MIDGSLEDCLTMQLLRIGRSGLLLRRYLIAGFLVAATAGCATLPSSGPTGHGIYSSARDKRQPLPFTIIEVDNSAALPATPGIPVSTLEPPIYRPTDLIGRGDVLDITIYEAGVALFGGAGRSGATPGDAGQTGVDTTAKAEELKQIRVDDAGYITLPFAGRQRAEGRTARDLAASIRRSLVGLSQDPQVLVRFAQSVTNSIIMAGEIARPGRLVLQTNRETLNESIALAGGYKGDAQDIVARVERSGQEYQIRLGDLLSSSQFDVPIGPGDRITLMSRPQYFAALGAPNKTEDIRFPGTKLTLAKAVAMAGGANPNAGDAAAIFVFRNVIRGDGTNAPLVYHVNMMSPGAYLLSQRFYMRNGDVLYIGNARANQASKFIQLLSQLFSPIVTLRSVAATGHSSATTLSAAPQ
jgi:polysaccharide export outer membrane protein